MNIRSIFITILLLFSFYQSSNAGIFTISTSDSLVRPVMDNQGWWMFNSSNSNATNDNYYTSDTLHSYFSFDLSSVVGTVVSAELQLRRYTTTAGSTLNLFDVSTSATDLAQRQVINNSIYTDLGSGTSYGSFLAGSGNSSDIMTFILNAAALSDINALATTYFSIGATSTNGVHFSTSNFEPGNGGPGYTQQLVLETENIPEPSTWLLLGFGLTGLAFQKKQKQQ